MGRLTGIQVHDTPQYMESVQGGYPAKALSLRSLANNSQQKAVESEEKPGGIKRALEDPRWNENWKRRVQYLYRCNPDDNDLLRLLKESKSREQQEHELRIAYIDMYPGHNPSLDILTHAIRASLLDITIRLVGYDQDPDLLIAGPYSYDITKIKRYGAKLVLYYTGENSRPNYYYAHLSLSQDAFDYCNKNHRFPFWMTEIDWFGHDIQHKREERLDPSCLYSQNMQLEDCPELNRRSKTIVSFSSNPTTLRLSFEEKARSAGIETEGYGAVYGRRFEGSKYSKVVGHMFCMAFENSTYPGYVTEKLFHAFRAGCIPLYWGDKEACKDFQLTPELNMAEYDNVEDFLRFIASLKSKTAEQLEAYSPKIFINRSRAQIGPTLMWLKTNISTRCLGQDIQL
jgi:hypothetical protein